MTAQARRDHLQEIIAQAIISLGYEFVGSEVIQGKGRLLRIYVDSLNGISVSDCERVSRQVSAVLNVEDPFHGHYELEVSSPGLDRPLYTLEHYQHFIGKQVKIRLRTPQNGRRNFQGTLQAVNVDMITVTGDGETWQLPFADIDKANLVPQF
jgi:ribosome maturation factor RimP